jgi:hypothetical protein
LSMGGAKNSSKITEEETMTETTETMTESTFRLTETTETLY